MNTLIINSSEKQAEIGLVINDKIINYKMDETKSHSEFLLKEIEDLLVKNNLDILDIDSFGVNVGPGSFTGVRIGISFVKAFMCAKNIKTVVINNFEIIEDNIENKPKEFFVLLSRNNDEFYYAKFDEKITYGYSNEENFNNVINAKNLNCYIKEDEKEVFKGIKNLTSLKIKNDSYINVALNKIKNYDFKLINDISPLYIKKSQAEQGLQNKINENLEILDSVKLEDLVKLESLCFSEENYSETLLKQDLENDNRKQFFAYYNNELIGYINFETILDEANLFKVCVLNEFRNYGIGFKLMQKMIDYCKQKNISKIFLEVDDKNLPAISLYEKFNFKQIDKRKNYYKNGNSAIIYEFKL